MLTYSVNMEHMKNATISKGRYFTALYSISKSYLDNFLQ